MKTIPYENSSAPSRTLDDLSRLARDLVALHFGNHVIGLSHPLALLECLARELQSWHHDGEMETVLAQIMPGHSDKTYRLISQLASDGDGQIQH